MIPNAICIWAIWGQFLRSQRLCSSHSSQSRFTSNWMNFDSNDKGCPSYTLTGSRWKNLMPSLLVQTPHPASWRQETMRSIIAWAGDMRQDLKVKAAQESQGQKKQQNTCQDEHIERTHPAASRRMMPISTCKLWPFWASGRPVGPTSCTHEMTRESFIGRTWTLHVMPSRLDAQRIVLPISLVFPPNPSMSLRRYELP